MYCNPFCGSFCVPAGPPRHLYFGTEGLNEQSDLEPLVAAIQHKCIIDTAMAYKNEAIIKSAVQMAEMSEPIRLTAKIDPSQLKDGDDIITFDQLVQKLRTHFTLMGLIGEGKSGAVLDTLFLHSAMSDPALNVKVFRQMQKALGDLFDYEVRLGLSNFCLKDLNDLLVAEIPIKVVQIEHNPFFVLKSTIEYCQSADIEVIGYRPFGGRSKKLAVVTNQSIIDLADTVPCTPGGLIQLWMYNRGINILFSSSSMDRIDGNCRIFQEYEIILLKDSDRLNRLFDQIDQMPKSVENQTCMAKWTPRFDERDLLPLTDREEIKL